MQGRWKQYHSWSRSRQGMYDSCRRKYYNRYVLFYEVPFGHELRAHTNIMRGMHNFDFFLGDIVHEAIENQLNQISRGREVPGANAAISYISRVTEEAIAQPEKHFIEALNGETIEAEKIAELGKEAERQVGIFFSEFFDFYKDLEFIEHERFSDFKIEGYTFWAKPDLVTRSNDGRVFITDWKTNSKYEHVIDPFQMNLYILWAIAKGHGTLSNIRGEVIFLDVGKSNDYKVTQEELDAFKEILVGNSRSLFDLIDSKNGIEDFPKCTDHRTCIGCGYYQYCRTQI